MSRDAPGVNVSSATVRSDMAALERDGIPGPAPHERRPDPDRQGLPVLRGPSHRSPGSLGSGQRQQVRQFFDRVHGEMEEMLERTSDPPRRPHRLRGDGGQARRTSRRPCARFSWSGWAPRLALLVVVLSDGAVEKRSIEFDVDVDDDLLSDADPAGRPLAGLARAHPGHGDRRKEHRRSCHRRRGGRRGGEGPALEMGQVRRGRPRSSWAGLRTWRRRSTPSTPCARC
jgi:hypothetical protein